MLLMSQFILSDIVFIAEAVEVLALWDVRSYVGTVMAKFRWLTCTEAAPEGLENTYFCGKINQVNIATLCGC